MIQYKNNLSVSWTTSIYNKREKLYDYLNGYRKSIWNNWTSVGDLKNKNKNILLKK